MNSGVFRDMLRNCPIGERLNRLRAVSRPLLGETPEGVEQRLYQKLMQASAGHECFDFQTCSACPRGVEILAVEAAEKFGVQPHHAEALLRDIGEEGWSRHMTNLCPVGQRLNNVLQLEGETAQLAAQTLDRKYGCSSRASCYMCGIGQTVLEEALRESAEHGTEGPLSNLLREGRLW